MDTGNYNNSLKLNEFLHELKSILQVDHIDPDDPLIEAGVNSINIVEILLCCERIYDVVVLGDEMIFDQYTTIRDIDAQASALTMSVAGE